MSRTGCGFCESLEIAERCRAEGWHNRYGAKLVTESVRDGEKQARGTVVYGTRPLRFCPECGAKIAGRLREIREAARAGEGKEKAE